MSAGREPDAPPAPTRDDVEKRLRALVDGADPGPISDWAGQWIEAEYADVDDDVVWDALHVLDGCDLPNLADPRRPPPMLHGHANHVAWLEEFLAARAADEGRPAESPRRAG